MANLLSFFGNLGKQIHGVEAQLNPFDGGQNYNTIVNNAPVQQQVPQPQQAQRPITLRPQGASKSPLSQGTIQRIAPNAPNMHMSAPTISAPKPVLNPQTIQHTMTPIQAATMPKMLNAQGQQQWLQQHPVTPPQAPAHNSIGNIEDGINKNVIQPAIQDANKAINTVQAPIAGAIGLGMAGADKVFNGGKNTQNILSATRGQMDQNIKNSFVAPAIAAGKASPAEFAKSFTQTGVHLAPYAVGGVDGKLIDAFGAKIGGDVASKIATPVLSKVAGKVASSAAVNTAKAAISAPVFASLNAIDQGVNGQKFDPMQATKAGLIASATVGATGMAGDAAGAITRPIADQISAKTPSVIAAAKAAVTDQRGSIGGMLANRHPAVVQLNDHLALLRQADQQLANQGMSPRHASRVNNVKAQVATIREIQNTQRKLSQGGYAKVPFNKDQASLPFNGDSNAPKFSPEHTLSANTAKTSAKVQSQGRKLVEPASSSKSIAPQSEVIGKALGMSPEEINSLPKADNMNGVAAAKTSSSPETLQVRQAAPSKGLAQTATGHSGEPLGRSDRQTGLQKSNVKSGSSSSDSKYTPNSTSVAIDKVAPGDYQKVRSNVQRIQGNVNVRARLAVHAVNKLSAAEKANFWNVVEGTSKATSSKMKEAVDAWHTLSDHVHATSQVLGGDTPHLVNYARHNWDLSDPKEAQRFTDLVNAKFADKSGRTISPEDFKGLDNKPRAFDTIAQGKALGFKLKNEGSPAKDIEEYVHSSNSKLKTQSVAQSMQEAEAHIPDAQKSITQHIGYKSNINVTQRGAHELRALYEEPKPVYTAGQKAVDYYDKANRGIKKTLLSLSQFHTINIGLQSIPTLAAKGHPIKATLATLDSAISTFSKAHADELIHQAIKDGTIDNAARIGTPILDGNDFNASGKLSLDAARGEKLVFERQLPAMHLQMVRAVVSDLKKRGVSLDSKEARAAGNEIHMIMGYVNTTLKNMSQRNMRGASRVMLAPNFTLSKWTVLKDAFTKGGQAGSYARSAVAGKYLAQVALIAGVGAIVGQKSDNIHDILLRALVHPAIPTPFKDSKGNTIELGIPSNYVSEAAGLVGSLKRGTDGRLSVSADPSKIPQNLENYGQGRLATIPSMALKVATNQNYAGKPLYDPTASTGSKIAQAATTLGVGTLPIGLQSLAYTNPVKNAVGNIPGVGKDIKNVLDAQTPGSNPIQKGIASALGATARTDQTVGKGQQTAQYYAGLDNAAKGLNRQEKDALDLYTGGKKNPVTGQDEITPNANDQRTKASVLLQNPKTLDHLITMNQSLASQGQTVDPLWKQSKDNITKYFQYQAMAPGSADKTDWTNKNTWYYGNPSNPADTGLAGQRNTFFSSLPKGDPNKPTLSIKYPDVTPQLQNVMDQYSNITDSKQKGAFIDSHPELLQQWNAQSKYTNDMRSALGYAPLKNSPEATPQLQSYMNSYNAADKATRKAIRNANPSSYQNMIAFYDSLDMYNINKQGAVSQLQGEPDYSSKQAKAIKSIAQDIYQNPDGSYSIVPAGWMNGLSNGSGYGSKGRKAARNKAIGLTSAVSSSNGLKIPTVKKFTPSKAGIVTPATYKKTILKTYSTGSKIPKIPTIKTRKRIA